MADDQHNVIPAHAEQVQGLTPVSERIVRKREGQPGNTGRQRGKKKARQSQDTEPVVLEPQILADEEGHVDFRA